jgi:hypothetical protein
MLDQFLMVVHFLGLAIGLPLAMIAIMFAVITFG